MQRFFWGLLLAAAIAQNAAPVPDRADLAYGPSVSQKLDLWLAKSARPTPLVVFIHGGGFVGGDKRAIGTTNLRRALEAGVSFASVNYRFITEVPIQTVLRDSARAIQYLRANAREFNLDKKRVAATGGSAGAGTSLWLAFHDDLADPGNADPVLRESTRIVAAAATSTQATYDLVRWPEIVGGAMSKHSAETEWPLFYRLASVDDLRSPEGKKLRADVDMLGLVSQDDPPVYLASSTKMDGLTNRGDVNHTSLHARAVKKRCDQIGVPATLVLVGDGSRPNEGGGAIGFLLKYLLAQ